jgi:membrane fusion protein, multidrug efflux system
MLLASLPLCNRLITDRIGAGGSKTSRTYLTFKGQRLIRLGKFRRELRLGGAVTLLFACLMANGCNRPQSQAAAPPAPPPPEVAMVEAVAKQITEFREFTGRTAAVDSVEIRPRVGGYVLQTPLSQSLTLTSESEEGPASLPDGRKFNHAVPSRPHLTDKQGSADLPSHANDDAKNEAFIVRVHEGEPVKAGDPLFEIDPEPYRLMYRQAVGNLAATQAELLRARRQLERLERLVKDNAASSAEFDVAEATAAQAEGSVENLKAAVDRAYLDWQYTQVRSPINGLVGRSQMTRGNLAVADQTVLTTVVTMDPIYVYFSVDEDSSLDYSSRVQQGKVQSARDSTIEVRMSLANEREFPHRGVIDFVDNTTDPNTGNKQVRARFDNPTGLITPGLYAMIQAPFTQPYEAVLVPTVAIAADQQSRYVMVVDEQSIARRRTIETGSIQGDQTVIRSGVKAGDRVIVSGLQRVRPNSPVKIAGEAPTSRTQPAAKEKAAIPATKAVSTPESKTRGSDAQEATK